MLTWDAGLECIAVDRVRCDLGSGQSVPDVGSRRMAAAAPALGVAVLFFGSVNQVLVRLWARVTRVSVFGSVSGSRCSADLSDRACCLDRGA
jgi:hypothetical protein